HKYHADGTLRIYKARLVANRRSQQFGVDYDDTFSPVVKPATVRMVVNLALSQNWPIHQLDVNNAFLNGDLFKTVYMYQPLGYANIVGFSSSRCDSSLFIYQHGSEVAYLLIYVDDIVLTASSTNLLQYFRLQLYASITCSLVAYTDDDWAGCLTTRRSTSGYCVFLGDNLLSWSAKRQHALSRSSAEAEYKGVANVQTKHIEIDIHFVRDMVTRGQGPVLHVPSRYQYADIFTKGLPSALFEEFHTSLSVRPSLAQTAGAY
ncbi:ribonuclease H-like domain-containing protein, partial [Tanacetum coccineum]